MSNEFDVSKFLNKPDEAQIVEGVQSDPTIEEELINTKPGLTIDVNHFPNKILSFVDGKLIAVKNGQVPE